MEQVIQSKQNELADAVEALALVTIEIDEGEAEVLARGGTPVVDRQLLGERARLRGERDRLERELRLLEQRAARLEEERLDKADRRRAEAKQKMLATADKLSSEARTDLLDAVGRLQAAETVLRGMRTDEVQLCRMVVQAGMGPLGVITDKWLKTLRAGS